MKITLCGSAKFETEFKKWNKLLTLQGHIVYSLAVYPSDEGNKNWYTNNEKLILDRVHKLKIDNSDAIFIINKNDYIGDSTISEINYARATNKRIVWAYKYNWKCNCEKDTDEFLTCPYAGCRDQLNCKPPCAICYE